jgi:hypothetical protein
MASQPKITNICLKLTPVLQAALKTTAALKPGSDTELDAQILEDIASDAPSTTLSRDKVLQPVADVMAACKLQPTKSAAKRCVFADSLIAKI